MILYAVFNKTTGEYLPTIGHRGAVTHMKPELPNKRTPRFHRRRQDAVLALTHWLRGPAVTKYDARGEAVGYVYDIAASEFPRIPEQWEVIPVTVYV